MAAFGKGSVHHLRNTFDGLVFRGAGNGAVKFHLIADEGFGLASGRLHAIERGAHGFEVVRCGASRSQLGDCGFQDLAEFVEFGVFDFFQQQHPLEVSADHAAESRLEIGAIAGARFQQAKADESFGGLAQGGTAYAKKLCKPWLRGQATAAAKLAGTNKIFESLRNAFDRRLSPTCPGWGNR